MGETPQAEEGVKRRAFPSLDALNAALAAEQAPTEGVGRLVPGEGPVPAALAFVGEQPGDEEDRQGRPFVGPAGRLLNQALEETGLDRSRAYVTNAVKRFHFSMRGKRRLHSKPTAGEISHDRWWLEKELAFVRPRLVVALGATAGQALAGRQVSVTRERGPHPFGPWPGFLTVHPSYLLRIPEGAGREAAYRAFLADLSAIRRMTAS
ncbi:DNA polymerase [Ancylobacter sp. 3268]|nr:DNA polymerase [Ancylobacter sp. 3268]